MLPIGVGQTVRRPAIALRALLDRHRRSADHPGVGAELGGDDARRFIGGSARVRSSRRAGSSSRSPAAATPPPITITSGSKMFA